MSRINVVQSFPSPVTHEGGKAKRNDAFGELQRAVMACLLWEDSFYESGESIADRIKSLVPKVAPERVTAMAIDARSNHGLRHVPLLLVRELARTGGHNGAVEQALAAVIKRPDELSEFLALYWATNGGKKSIGAAIKRGLSLAFNKFDEYALAKYNRDSPVKLRDVLFLSHAKPADAVRQWTRVERKNVREMQARGFNPKRAWAQTDKEVLFEKLVTGTLHTPDTWEVALSAGADKKATFERLMAEGQLGGLAFIRNLRNMREVGVDAALIRTYSTTAKVWGILPWQFITAARINPWFESELEAMLYRALDGAPKLPGHTVVLVDVSGSMSSQLSQRGESTRLDGAAGVAVLARELCESAAVYKFNASAVLVPNRRGFALRDAIGRPAGGTHMAAAIRTVNAAEAYDRIIVVSDEQSADGSAPPLSGKKGYMLNVGTYKNGVGYGPWTNISGWSPSVLRYIAATETKE